MSQDSPLLYDVADGIATLTINRPEAMNTLTLPTMAGIIEALDKADADDDVKVIIITGQGDRAFCAGADLSQGGATFDYASKGDHHSELKVNGIFRDRGGWMTLRIFNCLKPVIAVLNGSAAGVGASLSASADFRLASNRAKLVFPFVRRGIVPDGAASWFLQKAVGTQTTLDWCITGRTITAEEAFAKGFFRSLHEPADLMPAAHALAREIIENCSPVSVALTRRLIWRIAGTEHPMEAHMADSRGISMRGPSADVKEGISAFMEKRAPNFPGRVSTDMPEIFPYWEEPTFR